jgi:hypothetical protein
MFNSLQKVRSRGLLIYLFFSMMFFPGCLDKPDNNLAAFRSLNESMEDGSTAIVHSTETILRELEEKTKDSSTVYRARIWYPNALHVGNLTKGLYRYIDSLKTELKKASSEDDADVVYLMFEANEQGKELERKIFAYRDSLFAIHDHLDSAFRTVMFAGYYNDAGKPREGIIRNSFKEIPMIAAVAMLSHVQQNIRTIENRMTRFCRNKTPDFDDYFYTFSAIIGQSSTIVEAGDMIEIFAGVGAFNKMARAEVTINGRAVPLQDEGVASYKLKAPDKPGKHIVPVKITYINQETGRKDTINKRITYTVH